MTDVAEGLRFRLALLEGLGTKYPAGGQVANETVKNFELWRARWPLDADSARQKLRGF